MDVRTFHARNMATGLALVKRALGGDAVILHTRTVRRGGLFGFGAKEHVEITAALGVEVRRQKQRAQQQREAQQRQSLPQRRSTVPARQVVPSREPDVQPMAGDLIRKTYAAARAEFSKEALSAASQQAAMAQPTGSQMQTLPTAPGVLQPLPTGTDSTQLTQELQTVKRMVARMMRHQKQSQPVVVNTSGKRKAGSATSPGAATEVPDKLFDRYLALLEQEVTEELAEEIVQQVREKLGPPELADDDAVHQAVHESIAKLIPTGEGKGTLSPTEDGRPRTIALIGPTGVGKTTTIAKLAATFKLKQHKSVALITLDTYRIAAVDQLKTYASIIGVPLHVAVNTDELRNALYQCKHCDVVLIDTAGRSQRDDPRLEQLQSLIACADPHEVHLVLSSTCSQSVLMETVTRFEKVRTDRIIFTKLDEAVSFGVLLNVARRVNKQLSYVTTGQEVPHQIEPTCPKRLAELVMGGAVSGKGG